MSISSWQKINHREGGVSGPVAADRLKSVGEEGGGGVTRPFVFEMAKAISRTVVMGKN